MILSANTINVLKNFSTINPSILIRKGSVIRTVSPEKTIMGKAVVEETFPEEFAIYKLSQFVNSISMLNNPEFTFSENCIHISDNISKVVYYCSPASLISHVPHEKDIKFPPTQASFHLSSKDFININKALCVLDLPEIVVIGDGNNLTIEAVNTQNESSNKFTINIGETDAVFKAIFKAENLKMLNGNYDVVISAAVAHFKGKDIEYWVATEQSSYA